MSWPLEGSIAPEDVRVMITREVAEWRVLQITLNLLNVTERVTPSEAAGLQWTDVRSDEGSDRAEQLSP